MRIKVKLDGIYLEHIKGEFTLNKEGIMNLKLSPLETLQLCKKLEHSLFDWCKLTGKKIDDPKCKI